MSIDPGVAAVRAAAIAVLGAGVGAVIAYLLEGRRITATELCQDNRIAAAERRQDVRDGAERLRRMELMRIDHTRRELERGRFQVIAMRSGESAVIPFADILERSDLRLVGEAEAATAWVRVTRRIADECMAELTATGVVRGRALTPQEQNELADIRAAVMDALDAQERRVLNDSPMIVLERI